MSESGPYGKFGHLEMQVEQHFNKVAPTYDKSVAETGWSRATHNLMCRELSILPYTPQRVLDLGAGTGTTTEAVLACTDPEQVVAVDISETMLSMLKYEHPDPRIDAKHTAVEAFLLETKDRFDLVVAIGMLHFVPNQQQIISGVGRLLSRGGYFIFSYDPFIPGEPNNHAQMTGGNGMTIFRQYPEKINRCAEENDMRVVRNRIYAARPEHNFTYRGGLVVAQKL